MRRRTYLTLAGTTLTAALAGCTEESDERESGGTDGSDNTETDTEPEDDNTDDDSETETDSEGGEDETADDGSGDGDDSDDPVEILEHEWYNNGQFDVGVTGQVENISGEELTYVGVEVYFLDEEGVQFEEGLDNTTDLADGRIWEFDAGYLGDDPQRVDEYEIEWDVTNY